MIHVPKRTSQQTVIKLKLSSKWVLCSEKFQKNENSNSFCRTVYLEAVHFSSFTSSSSSSQNNLFYPLIYLCVQTHRIRHRYLCSAALGHSSSCLRSHRGPLAHSHPQFFGFSAALIYASALFPCPLAGSTGRSSGRSSGARDSRMFSLPSVCPLEKGSCGTFRALAQFSLDLGAVCN